MADTAIHYTFLETIHSGDDDDMTPRSECCLVGCINVLL